MYLRSTVLLPTRIEITLPNQFGFTKGRSTAHAVRQLCDEFVDNLDNGKITCAVFLELSKAFDTVNHQILIKKLEHYGIRGLPLQLLISYLTDTFQYTIVNNVKSNLKQVKCGVPRGSTLGPLLFLIYINDLSYLSKFNTKLFADNTVLTLSNSCIKTLQQEVNQALEEIKNWMKLNKLYVNSIKTKYMLIKGNRKSHTLNKCNIHIGKHKLEQVSEIKYLGIMFDNKLPWKPHIKQ